MKNKVIIAGSRNFDEFEIVSAYIEYSGFRIDEVVCGSAAGVDTCGMYYAMDHNIPIKYFLPDWKKHGKAAGPIRNSEMVEYCTHGIYVINNHSRGSMDCLNKIKAALKPFTAYHLTDGILDYVETESGTIDRADTRVVILRQSFTERKTASF